MRLAFTALAALAAALVELSVVPHFGLSGAHPHLVLVLGVIATLGIGPEAGLVWAFTGGIALDVLAGRPLGVTAFTLLVVLASVGLLTRSAPRLRLLAALAVLPLCSAMSSVILVAALRLLSAPAAAPDPSSLVAGAAYDTALALVLAPLAFGLVERRSRAGHVHG